MDPGFSPARKTSESYEFSASKTRFFEGQNPVLKRREKFLTLSGFDFSGLPPHNNKIAAQTLKWWHPFFWKAVSRICSHSQIQNRVKYFKLHFRLTKGHRRAFPFNQSCSTPIGRLPVCLKGGWKCAPLQRKKGEKKAALSLHHSPTHTHLLKLGTYDSPVKTNLSKAYPSTRSLTWRVYCWL